MTISSESFREKGNPAVQGCVEAAVPPRLMPR